MAASMLSPKSAIRLALFATLLAAGGFLWIAWCEFPFYTWNEMRLEPAFALRYGVNPYPPVGGGPLSTWIYGPVGIFVNLPATFAHSAVGALHIASVINAVMVLAPLAAIFFGSAELRARGIAIPALALLLGLLLLPRANLTLQVADNSAIAFGLLSCWCLARRSQPSHGRLAIAAGFCALGIWSKQIEVFLLFAQMAFLFFQGQRATALRYFAWVFVFCLIGLGIFVYFFSFSNLWLNLFAIPGRLPWAEFWPRFTMRPRILLGGTLLPLLGLAVLWRRGFRPKAEQESGRFLQLVSLVFLAMLPVGFAAFFKIGGDTNLLHSWNYFMPGCLLAGLATAQVATPFRVLAVAALALALQGRDLAAWSIRPFTTNFSVAAQLTAAHPHAIWFPQNPLITFYADGRIWHSEDGLLTRYAADYGLREPDFRRHLPENLQAVAYPTHIEFPFALPLLPELNQKVEYLYWTVYTRAPKPPAKP